MGGLTWAGLIGCHVTEGFRRPAGVLFGSCGPCPGTGASLSERPGRLPAMMSIDHGVRESWDRIDAWLRAHVRKAPSGRRRLWGASMQSRPRWR